MAIANTFTFGGVSTTAYNVTVEGAGDYSGAKRAVEMISIPGRDGAFALDKGYFENEPVEYDVLIQGATQATFESAVSSFRNAILSKRGYQRLTDTYHPNEYRMAVYVGGFDEEPTFHGKGASFKVKFDCQPQRYLTSGETKQTIAASGDTITNPTLFSSKPLLEVEGYGTLNIGDQAITIHNDPIGDVTVISSEHSSGQKTFTVTFDDTFANVGDVIRVGEARYTGQFYGAHTSGSISHSGDISSTEFSDRTSNIFALVVTMSNKQFVYGTSATLTGTATGAVVTSDYGTLNVVVNMSVAYDGADEITITITTTVPSQIAEWITGTYPIIVILNVILESSQYSIGTPLYVDLDIGEAYKVESGSVVSVNNAVQIPAELPTLKPGSNTITFDNTITSLKITPRWYKI